MTGDNPPGDGQHIYRALARLRDVTGLPLTFGGPVNTKNQLVLAEFAGTHHGAMRGVLLDPGRGLGGKVVARRRPMVVNDYVTAPQISHHYDQFIKAEALRAMVAVPVVVRRRVRGVVYGAIRTADQLGDRAIRLVLDTARDLEQTLAVQDELTSRMNWLDEQAAIARTGEKTPPQWELVRESYAELRLLLQEVTDARTRQRMDTVCAKLAAAYAADRTTQAVPHLSAREVDVLSCAALGWTNNQVAADLDLGTETVKTHLRSAMRKLGAHSRLEAVVAARRLGLLP